MAEVQKQRKLQAEGTPQPWELMVVHHQNIRSKNAVIHGRTRCNIRCNALKQSIQQQGIDIAFLGEGKLRRDETLHPPSGCGLITTNGAHGSFGLCRQGAGVQVHEVQNNQHDSRAHEAERSN